MCSCPRCFVSANAWWFLRVQVTQLQGELTLLQPVLDQKTVETEALLVRVRASSMESSEPWVL